MFNCCSNAVPPSNLASSTPQLHFLYSGPTTLILSHFCASIFFYAFTCSFTSSLDFLSPSVFSVTVSINLALRPCSRFIRRTSVFLPETSFPNLRPEVSIHISYFHFAVQEIVLILQLVSCNINYHILFFSRPNNRNCNT